jgi:aminobenzoyl-glutamate utilization protein A
MLAQIATEEAGHMARVKEAVLHRNFGASEDAAIFMRDVHQQGGQATYILLGADLSAGHHNERFDFDEDTLPIGLELLGRLLVRILGT